MQNRNYFFILCLIIGIESGAQKRQYENYNVFITYVNQTVDSINSSQQDLQQYHQDLFRFFRIFDSLSVQPLSYTPWEGNAIEVPEFAVLEFQQFQSHLQTYDSIARSIDFEKDLQYSKPHIDSLNQRIHLIEKLTNTMQEDVVRLQNRFTDLSLDTHKRSYKIMLEEIEKVEFLIKKWKRNKIEIHEMEYYIPEKIRKQLPPHYLDILLEFQTRLESCKTSDNKEEIIHYFLPQKYFDKWILKKYSLKYWQIKYLEDVLIHPTFERGLKTYYNESVENYSLQTFKSINEYESLPFEFIPISDSPLGRHQKIFFVLILDISNSMNEFNKLENLKQSVKTFVDALRPQDKFSIILFSNVSQELVLPGEKDKEFIKYELDNIKAFGNTLPESAIFRAYNIMNLQTNKEFDNQVILITDGIFDVTGKMKYHINLGAKKDIVFSIINIENNGENYNELKKMTEISGGKLYFSQDVNTYDVIIEELLRK